MHARHSRGCGVPGFRKPASAAPRGRTGDVGRLGPGAASAGAAVRWGSGESGVSPHPFGPAECPSAGAPCVPGHADGVTGRASNGAATSAGGAARPDPIRLLRRAAVSDHEHGRLPALLLTLTMLSGIIDAVSVLRLGNVFVSNMTGNLVFVGLGLARAVGFSLRTTVIAVGCFIVGVAACRWWFRVRRERLAQLRDILIGQAVLLGIAAAVSGAVGGSPTGTARYAVVGVCAAAMGGQNAVARRMGVRELTTTVMTGTLVGLLSGSGESTVAQARQSIGIIALVVGAAIGAALVRASDATAPLAVCAAIASAVALGATIECRRVLRSRA